MVIRFSPLLSATLLLGACSYVTDGSVQDVTVLTPGANNAECKLSLGSVQYAYNPPMTRSIQKSEENMVVDCWAPGNRHKVVNIAPNISSSTLYNAGHGVAPGLAWDYASKSMYYFPKTVEVDFTQMEVKPFPLPAQNQDDIRPPEDYDLEEFSPSQPRLNSDRYATKPEIRPRQIPTDFDLQGFATDDEGTGEAAVSSEAVSDPNFIQSTKQPGVTRVIGKTSGGIAVPTPPTAKEKEAAASAKSSAQSSSQQQENVPAENSNNSQTPQGLSTGVSQPSEPATNTQSPQGLIPPGN